MNKRMSNNKYVIMLLCLLKKVTLSEICYYVFKSYFVFNLLFCYCVF